MTFPISKLSLSDLEGLNLLDLYNTQIENEKSYVNPKELDHNDDTNPKLFKVQSKLEARQSNDGDISEKQGPLDQLVIDQDTQVAEQESSWQPSSTTDSFTNSLDSSSQESTAHQLPAASSIPKIQEQQSETKGNNEATQPQIRISQQFAYNENSQPKVVVIPNDESCLVDKPIKKKKVKATVGNKKFNMADLVHLRPLRKNRKYID